MPKQSIPVLAALDPSTTFDLDLTNANSSAPAQTTLALYRPPSSASSAQGILYEIVKLDHQDASPEPSQYMTYALWQGSDDDYYELQNHEDPYVGYLIQKTWEDGDEVRYKGITTDLRRTLWRMRVGQPCAVDAVPCLFSLPPSLIRQRLKREERWTC